MRLALAPHNSHLGRRLNTNVHTIANDPADRDRDSTSEDETFANFPAKYQHEISLL